MTCPAILSLWPATVRRDEGERVVRLGVGVLGRIEPRSFPGRPAEDDDLGQLVRICVRHSASVR